MGSFDYKPATTPTASMRWRKPFAANEGLKPGIRVAEKNQSMVSPARASGYITSLGVSGIAANSTTLVAVGKGAASGSTSTNLTSPDGVTWTVRNTLLSQSWEDVVWNGTNFVAVANSGSVAHSSNGITWTAGAAIPGGSTHNAIIVFNGKTYGFSIGVATASYGESSDSGATWDTKTAPTSVETPRLGVVVIGGVMYNLRGNVLYSTTDGTNWTLVKTFDKIGSYLSAPNFVVGNSKALIVGFFAGPTVVTSVSKNGGATWTQFAALRFANLPTESASVLGASSPTISGRADYNVGIGVGRVNYITLQRALTMASGRMLIAGSLTEYDSTGTTVASAYHAFVMTSADGSDWTAGLAGSCSDGASTVALCEYAGEVYVPMVNSLSNPISVFHRLNNTFEELIYDY